LSETICCNSRCWNTKLIVIQGTVIRIVSDIIIEGLRSGNPTVKSHSYTNWWANVFYVASSVNYIRDLRAQYKQLS
jgi:hypothetical protein